MYTKVIKFLMVLAFASFSSTSFAIPYMDKSHGILTSQGSNAITTKVERKAERKATRQTERKAERKAEKKAARQTERRAERKTTRQTERQAENMKAVPEPSLLALIAIGLIGVGLTRRKSRL